jgi:hypothetical protein
MRSLNIPLPFSATLTNSTKLLIMLQHFFFEWVIASMFKGIPGYALEQFDNLGTQELQIRLPYRPGFKQQLMCANVAV